MKRVKAWMEKGVKGAAKVLQDNLAALTAVAEALRLQPNPQLDQPPPQRKQINPTIRSRKTQMKKGFSIV